MIEGLGELKCQGHFFYLGTNILKMTEDQFWNSTPKKLQGLFNVYKKINGIEDEERLEYIDNITF